MVRLVCILVSVVVLNIVAGAFAADQPVERPGLALSFEVDANQAKLVVAFDYLKGAADRPRLLGGRRYTYEVPLGAPPVRVGWKGDKATTVVLDGVKYGYTSELGDRHENGSITIAAVSGDPSTFRIRGVYYYSNQLFIIDAVVKEGDPVLLYEKTDAK